MNTSEMVKKYLKEVEYYFPYSKHKRKIAIESLEEDITDTLSDVKTENPYKVFGSPYLLAKNYSMNFDWGIEKASWGRRILAFLIDMYISIIILLFWLIVIVFYWYNFFYGEGSYLYNVVLNDGNGSYSILDLELLIIEVPFLMILILAYISSFGHPALFERIYATTLGKKTLRMISCDESGVKLTWEQVSLRNLSKLIPGLLLIELLIGKVFYSSIKIRIFDKFANSNVFIQDIHSKSKIRVIGKTVTNLQLYRCLILFSVLFIPTILWILLGQIYTEVTINKIGWFGS